ncbi:MAG: anthranilate phosphoribosyltransferase [Nitrospirota bacterium]
MAAFIKEAIQKVIDGAHLSEAEAERVMTEIMQGEASAAQIGGYLVALRMKGETVEEITGSARVMREKAIRIRANDALVVDTCGTGGDRRHTFNISTTAAFVVAGAGVTVAKHGNRSVSSSCGSADLLKALGVSIELTPVQVEACLNQVGIGFLFAPLFHTAMQHTLGPRREIGVRTLFNLLGPLTNPADATIQVVGVYAPELTDLIGQVLMKLGRRHCFVVHGEDGLDEITITGRTKICEGKEGRIQCYHLEPKDFGLPVGRLADLKGGTAEENARLTLAVLKGEKGPRRDIVLLNAAPALVACGKAKTLQEGVAVAASVIDSGAAMEKLDALRQCSRAVA